MLQAIVNDNNTFQVSEEGGQMLLDGQPADWHAITGSNGLLSVLHNGQSYIAVVEKVDKAAKEVMLRINGQAYKIAIREEIDLLLKSMGLDLKAMQKVEPVKAPMPGMILKILVEPGQQINKGDGLLILEAMKMENVLKATASATVKGIRVTERTAVEKGAVLIDLE